MNETVSIDQEDQIKFREWLDLDVESITWEGRYINEFNSLWAILFPSDILIEEQFKKIKFAQKVVKSGPLVSWFQWIFDKFISFAFIYKDLKIKDLSAISGVNDSELALILRGFFVERFPHLEEKFNHKFQLAHVISKNIELDFKSLADEMNITSDLKGSIEDDILKNLEVTLYDDWTELSKKMKEDKDYQAFDYKKIIKNVSFKKQVKFLQELVLLFIVGGALIFSIKVGNNWYENYLVNKITLFESNFFWLDKNLSFKTKNPLGNKEIELSFKELEKLEKLESKKVFEDAQATKRFEVESDVVLTSVDTLPKDFDVANLEQSDYEEVRKGGYRNTRYGRRKAFRVMMTSVDPDKTKRELVKFLDTYHVKQVDNVKPGMKIPGGIYFNLHVPQKVLKEFLSKVTSIEESTILESKTRFGGPAGMNKVFIWIKSI